MFRNLIKIFNVFSFLNKKKQAALDFDDYKNLDVETEKKENNDNTQQSFFFEKTKDLNNLKKKRK